MQTIFRRSTHIAFALAMLTPAVMPAPAAAADLSVNPARVLFSGEQRSISITLRNDSNTVKTIQITAVARVLREGAQTEVPTTELVVSPPAVSIAPSGEQTITAALKRAPDANRELSYRIYLREFQAQSASGSSGVRISLRTYVPVSVPAQSGIAAP